MLDRQRKQTHGYQRGKVRGGTNEEARVDRHTLLGIKWTSNEGSRDLNHSDVCRILTQHGKSTIPQ